MTRTKRDYCLIGRHPRWRAWRVDYTMKPPTCFCTECGTKIDDIRGSGDPALRTMGRMRVLRAGRNVTIEDYRVIEQRRSQYRAQRYHLYWQSEKCRKYIQARP